jgi:hypothetical protein
MIALVSLSHLNPMPTCTVWIRDVTRGRLMWHEMSKLQEKVHGSF